MNADNTIAHYRKEPPASQPLSEHLFGVAKLARRFAAKVGLADQGELLGLLHDLGKSSQQFQAYLKSAVGLLNQDEDADFVNAADLRGKVDHSTAGAQLLWRELGAQGGMGSIVGQMLALCIASHHSGLIDCLTSSPTTFGDDAFGRRIEKAEDRAHLEESLAKLDPNVWQRVNELLARPDLVAGIQGAMTAIVQLAPNRHADGPVARLQCAFLLRYLFSCLIDADRSDSAAFDRPQQAKGPDDQRPNWDGLTARFEAHLAAIPQRHQIDALRHEISAQCLAGSGRPPGLYSLTVPTGGGKTLASLRFALHHAKTHNLERIVYFVPFTSIIDQSARVARDILEPDGTPAGSVVLEHHSNLAPEHQTWRNKLLADNWDAPIIFTTNVQFLEAMFGAGTRGVRRLHQLARAVMIFDEVQTVPVNCVHLFNNALNFLVEQCRTTALLCTATQPLLHQVDPFKGAARLLANSELMPDVKGLFERLKRVDVLDRRKAGGWSNDEIADLAITEAHLADSCLVVVNTKRAAQALYRLCKGKVGAVYHLSTNMCPAHRRAHLAMIRRLLEEPEGPLLCFSTQLIEAGVDIDFGTVIRFTAGLDSIAQASGRCNRHGGRPTGRVHVVNPTDESLDRLTDIRVGRDTSARVLDDYADNPSRFDNSLIGPKAMDWYYQNYFYSRSSSMDYPVSAASIGHDDTLLSLLSSNDLAVGEYNRLNRRPPNFWFRQSFKAAAQAFRAIDAPTRGVIVPYDKAGEDLVAELSAAVKPEWTAPLLRRAQQFSVNVFGHVLARLEARHAVRELLAGTGILGLDRQYYDDEFGLSETPVRPMEFQSG